MTYATEYVKEMVSGYVVAALWSSTDFDNDDTPLDENYGPEDVAPETAQSMWDDVTSFYVGNADDLARAADVITGYGPESAGQDFWLTRNHHGAGFWDRGLGDIGRRLTDAAQIYGGCDLYVGNDGKVHSE